jgi:hypothetical protein
MKRLNHHFRTLLEGFWKSHSFTCLLWMTSMSLILFLIGSGCSQSNENESPSQREDLEKNLFQVKSSISTIKELQSENADLNKKMTDLTSKVTALETTLFKVEDSQRKLNQRATDLEFRLDQYQAVNLDESEKGYQRLETESGFFLVKIQGHQPFLDGYKLFIEVLNPNAVSYSGVTLSIKWGHAFDPSRLSESVWATSLREKETKLPTPLSPGSRTPIEIILPRTTNEELGFISVSMQTEGVTAVPHAANQSSIPQRNALTPTGRTQ